MTQVKGSRNGLRRVRWWFDFGQTFPGFTDETTWKGFLNVWVTPATHARVVRMFEKICEPDTVSELREMAPDLRGLISYANGYATQEM